MPARAAGENASLWRGADFGREGAGVEVGVLDRKVPGRATVTLRFSANASLKITSAHFPRKPDVSSASLGTLLGASGPLVAGAGVSSHHVLWDPFRPGDGKGECIVDWCVQSGLSIANAGSANRRQPGTAALSSSDITLCRDWEISNRKSALSPHSDHYWITFDAFVGASLDATASSKPARAPHAWNKARWHEFRKLSDEFIFRRMGRSAKGADAMNEAVTRGIRMAAKRTLPKGKGVGPPFWTPELTKLDVAQREPSSDTAPDDDEVNCEELKQLGRETKKCVVRLLNCSLRTGQVPAKWGHGIIVPLLKPNKPRAAWRPFGRRRSRARCAS
ncbi:hypothetical protein ERJ75_001694400 [Trypanosoma vivax]|nr:hypothetical protein ERJ75_001694400 [Trypanosoma vivax]